MDRTDDAPSVRNQNRHLHETTAHDDAALEQRGTRTPLQRKTDDRQRDGVISRIAEKIETIRAQAHGTGDEGGFEPSVPPYDSRD